VGEVLDMALAVLFLLVGMLFAELSLFGVDVAGVAGAALLAVAALVLLRRRDAIEPRTR
jgi:MYXO-CTERM domain-containing protein